MQMQVNNMSQMVIVWGQIHLDISNVSHYKHTRCILGQHMREGIAEVKSVHQSTEVICYMSPKVQQLGNMSDRTACVGMSVNDTRAHTHSYMCVPFTHAAQSQRDPVPLLCSILINPAMTERVWQVMYVLRLG